MGDEGLYVELAIHDIHQNGINIENFTLDGDSSARKVVTVMKQPDPNLEITVLYCTRHLNKLMQMQILKCDFSANMFIGRRKEDKTRLQSLFSYGMVKRIHAEFCAVFVKYDGDK